MGTYRKTAAQACYEAHNHSQTKHLHPRAENAQRSLRYSDYQHATQATHFSEVSDAGRCPARATAPSTQMSFQYKLHNVQTRTASIVSTSIQRAAHSPHQNNTPACMYTHDNISHSQIHCSTKLVGNQGTYHGNIPRNSSTCMLRSEQSFSSQTPTSQSRKRTTQSSDTVTTTRNTGHTLQRSQRCWEVSSESDCALVTNAVPIQTAQCTNTHSKHRQYINSACSTLTSPKHHSRMHVYA